MLEQSTVQYEVNDGVGLIKINSPKTRNALSANIKEGLLAALSDAEQNPEVRVIVLSGEGKAFCAGGDVIGMGERTVLQSVDKITATTTLPIKIHEMNKTIIVAVNGYAMGAGFSLALAGDLIFADEKAIFGLSFAKVGLIPDAGLLYHLPRIVGPWKAKELIYGASVLSAKEGEAFGFVNRVVEEGQVLEEAMEYARNLAKGPVQITRFINSIINKTGNSDLRGTIEYENFAQSILQQSDDHREGVQAFKEKRNPDFLGK